MRNWQPIPRRMREDELTAIEQRYRNSHPERWEIAALMSGTWRIVTPWDTYDGFDFADADFIVRAHNDDIPNLLGHFAHAQQMRDSLVDTLIEQRDQARRQLEELRNGLIEILTPVWLREKSYEWMLTDRGEDD